MDKGNFNSKGVVVNEKLQEDANEHIQDCAKALDLEPKGILNSRVLARDRNKNFWACFRGILILRFNRLSQTIKQS